MRHTSPSRHFRSEARGQERAVPVGRRGEIVVIATKEGRTTYEWITIAIGIYGGDGRLVERRSGRSRNAGTNSRLGVKRDHCLVQEQGCRRRTAAEVATAPAEEISPSVSSSNWAQAEEAASGRVQVIEGNEAEEEVVGVGRPSCLHFPQATFQALAHCSSQFMLAAFKAPSSAWG
jgi:hypothetical protein